MYSGQIRDTYCNDGWEPPDTIKNNESISIYMKIDTSLIAYLQKE